MLAESELREKILEKMKVIPLGVLQRGMVERSLKKMTKQELLDTLHDLEKADELLPVALEAAEKILSRKNHKS